MIWIIDAVVGLIVAGVLIGWRWFAAGGYVAPGGEDFGLREKTIFAAAMFHTVGNIRTDSFALSPPKPIPT